MNLTQLLNETNSQAQEKLESTIRKTTTEVVYDSRPTTMVIVQQIPQKVFVGAYMRFPIQVYYLFVKHQRSSISSKILSGTY